MEKTFTDVHLSNGRKLWFNVKPLVWKIKTALALLVNLFGSVTDVYLLDLREQQNFTHYSLWRLFGIEATQSTTFTFI